MNIVEFDNYVLDHAAEYMYDDPNYVRWFFGQDPHPFIDAVGKIIDAAIFASEIRVPPASHRPPRD